MDKPKFVALYLPQFHPFKENDEWWGKGYSEWTSVAQAKPQYPGHYQPKIPGDLGFYDLRLKETRQAQADLAKQYGVDAFCYYYYRLNKDLHPMDSIIKDVLATGEPDFPFMFCWANHNWEAKEWNSYESYKSRMLAVQEYGDAEDVKAFFMEVLPYFKDSRYLKEDNCPLFSFVGPMTIPNVEEFMRIWNELAKQNGFNGVKFWAYTDRYVQYRNELEKKGFDKIISCRLHPEYLKGTKIKKILTKIWYHLIPLPILLSYKKIIKDLFSSDEKDENVIPCVVPNWDPSPRRKRWVSIWTGITPELYGRQIHNVLELVKNKKNKWIFIKSWNEWGEGNYLEPDRKYGRKFLEEMKKEIDSYKGI